VIDANQRHLWREIVAASVSDARAWADSHVI
jgi:hypothetical protein